MGTFLLRKLLCLISTMRLSLMALCGQDFMFFALTTSFQSFFFTILYLISTMSLSPMVVFSRSPRSPSPAVSSGGQVKSCWCPGRSRRRDPGRSRKVRHVHDRQHCEVSYACLWFSQTERSKMKISWLGLVCIGSQHVNIQM